MTPPILQQPYPPDSYTPYFNRPIKGITLHHTATLTLYTPRLGGSAHKVFMPDGSIVNQIPAQHAAHTVLMTDKWRPWWVLRCPDGRVSDMNYCSLGYEICYAPQDPYNQHPTTPQLDSLYWQLNKDAAQYGSLPFVGHGDVQSDKWPTEAAFLDYNYLGLSPLDYQAGGRFWTPRPTPAPGPTPQLPYQTTDPSRPDYMILISDQDLKNYLEQLGTPVNMDTALIKSLAALAYRRGETRGPAISDEYSYTNKHGDTVTRQRFTAGTAEYNPATGGFYWVELNIDPEV